MKIRWHPKVELMGVEPMAFCLQGKRSPKAELKPQTQETFFLFSTVKPATLIMYTYQGL